MANGAKMKTDRQCTKLPIEIQGHVFEADLMLLDVSGYDVILGLDWLTTLGTMSVNWADQKLEFIH